MATEVEILGHKAKIERITGQAKAPSSEGHDRLVVWLSFDEAVGSVLSFATYLPAKKYADRDEFLYNVRQRGEEALKRILERNEQEKREMQEKDERQKVLDAVVAEVQRLIE